MVHQIIPVKDHRNVDSDVVNPNLWNASDLTNEDVKWLNELILQILGFDFETFTLMQGQKYVSGLI